MSIYEPSPSPWTGRMLSIFRIIAGVIFMTAGTMKMFGYPPSPVPEPIPPFDPMTHGRHLMLAGGGAWSVDALIARSQRK